MISMSENNKMNSWIMSAPKRCWVDGGADGCLRKRRTRPAASTCPKTAERTWLPASAWPYGSGVGPLQNGHGAELPYKMVMVVEPCRMDIVPISIIRWWWWWPLAEWTWCRAPLQDGDGGGTLQNGHDADLNYKMVVVVAPCRIDMVLISTT